MKKFLIVASLALSLTACGPTPTPADGAIPAAASDHGNGLLWGLGGFLLGRALSPSPSHGISHAPAYTPPARTVVIKKTTVVNNFKPAPSTSARSFRPSYGTRGGMSRSFRR